MRDLVIVGAGGLGQVLKQFVDDINRSQGCWRFAGFVDDAVDSPQRKLDGLPILGPVGWLSGRKDLDVLVGIGSPKIRRDLVARLVSAGIVNFPSIKHPGCYCPASVSIGRGTIVYPGVCIDPNVSIGAFVVIGRNANIGHGTRIDEYSSLSPGCSIGGNAVVATGGFIGIGACAIPQVRIGAWSVVGAGSAVTKDVPDHTTVVGVPARPMRGIRR